MKHEFTIFHFFAGIGGKGLGAANAMARRGDHEATFRTVGGIDNDPLACRDFEMLVGAPCHEADVHKMEPADLLRMAGESAPDAIMLSPPCKGLSALLSAKKALLEKYQEMNQLMLRALFLICSTWDRPPPLIFVENVPRMASRGKDIVRKTIKLLEAHGYAVTTGNHDCGELGGLAQHRRRWFLVARHVAQVPGFLYQPAKHRVRACGEVLGPLPMPGDVEAAGPMHSVPKLSLRNWIRLALIPAGGDWRNLAGVLAENQARRELFRRLPVTPWDGTAETVTGPGGSASTNIADPRFGHVDRVASWSEAVGAITSSPAPSSGAGAVADPRWGGGALGVIGWDEPGATVTGEAFPSNGRNAVADPRPSEWFPSAYRVGDWNAIAHTVTSGGHPSTGAATVADPRIAQLEFGKPMRADTYGVSGWDAPSAAVTGSHTIDTGRAAISDPRLAELALGENDGRHWNKYAVTDWADAALTVTGGDARIGSGAAAIADARIARLAEIIQPKKKRNDDLGVTSFEEPASTVTGDARPRKGRFSVADSRFDEGKKKNWQQVAGVTAWDREAPTITSGAKIHAGSFQVADPRIVERLNYRLLTIDEALDLDLPLDKAPPFIPVIVAVDGTWHRPLTTLELAVLQSFPHIFNGRPLVLAGNSHTRWRLGVGNAVPPAAALNIGNQLLDALLLATLGAFALNNNDIWVSPIQEAMVA